MAECIRHVNHVWHGDAETCACGMYTQQTWNDTLPLRQSGGIQGLLAAEDAYHLERERRQIDYQRQYAERLKAELHDYAAAQIRFTERLQAEQAERAARREARAERKRLRALSPISPEPPDPSDWLYTTKDVEKAAQIAYQAARKVMHVEVSYTPTSIGAAIPYMFKELRALRPSELDLIGDL